MTTISILSTFWIIPQQNKSADENQHHSVSSNPKISGTLDLPLARQDPHRHGNQVALLFLAHPVKKVEKQNVITRIFKVLISGHVQIQWKWKENLYILHNISCWIPQSSVGHKGAYKGKWFFRFGWNIPLREWTLNTEGHSCRNHIGIKKLSCFLWRSESSAKNIPHLW